MKLDLILNEMTMRDAASKAAKEDKDFPKAEKEFLKKHKLKSNQIEFLGVVDNGKWGKHYSWNIIDKKHPQFKSTLSINKT